MYIWISPEYPTKIFMLTNVPMELGHGEGLIPSQLVCKISAAKVIGNLLLWLLDSRWNWLLVVLLTLERLVCSQHLMLFHYIKMLNLSRKPIRLEKALNSWQIIFSPLNTLSRRSIFKNCFPPLVSFSGLLLLHISPAAQHHGILNQHHPLVTPWR